MRICQWLCWERNCYLVKRGNPNKQRKKRELKTSSEIRWRRFTSFSTKRLRLKKKRLYDWVEIFCVERQSHDICLSLPTCSFLFLTIIANVGEFVIKVMLSINTWSKWIWAINRTKDYLTFSSKIALHLLVIFIIFIFLREDWEYYLCQDKYLDGNIITRSLGTSGASAEAEWLDRIGFGNTRIGMFFSRKTHYDNDAFQMFPSHYVNSYRLLIVLRAFVSWVFAS